MEWFHTRYRSSYITIFLIFLFFLLFHLTIPLTHVKDDQLLFSNRYVMTITVTTLSF